MFCGQLPRTSVTLTPAAFSAISLATTMSISLPWTKPTAAGEKSSPHRAPLRDLMMFIVPAEGALMMRISII